MRLALCRTCAAPVHDILEYGSVIGYGCENRQCDNWDGVIRPQSVIWCPSCRAGTCRAHYAGRCPECYGPADDGAGHDCEV